MKLTEILGTYSDAAIDQLASDKMDESASLRLPRNIVQQEVVSALSSLSYVGSVLVTSKPPTYAILKTLLDAENSCISVDGFQEKVFSLSKDFSGMADSGKGLAGTKNYELYRKILSAAWSNDGSIDASEGKLLQALREELGIWTREHLLLEYHPEVQALSGNEKGYVESRNRLLSTGIMLSIENQFILASEVVIQLRRAWDIDIDDEDYRRLLNELTNERLYALCQDLGLTVSGRKEDRVERIVRALVPSKELLNLLTNEELSQICSASGVKVSGSKGERIDNIVTFFDEQRDLKTEEEQDEGSRAPDEAEPREMDEKDFRFVLEQLTGNQLYDLLAASLLKVSGAKEEKISRVVSSNWNERSILGRLSNSDLYHLCGRLDIRVSGLKDEKVGRIVEEVSLAEREAMTRAEIQEEEGHRSDEAANEEPVKTRIENLPPSTPATPPEGLTEIKASFPDLEEDEQIILALIRETRSITEKDVEKASRRHGLGWFLTKAHMSDLLAKLAHSGKTPVEMKSVHSINIYQWVGDQELSSDGITRRVARNIVDAIRQGVVPEAHLEHLAVGQAAARNHLEGLVDEAAAGGSLFKFIRGPYGGGKTFLCAWLREFALSKELAVTNMVIGPDQPLSDLPVFYAGLIQGLRTPEKRQGGALADILESWLLNIHRKTAKIEGISLADPTSFEKLGPLVEQRVDEELAAMSATDPGFAPAARAFYRARLENDQATAATAIACLSGGQSMSSQALRSVGVKGVLEPSQVFPRLRTLLKVIEGARYRGLVALVDEVELIRRYPQRKSREQAYETLRLLVDEAGKNGLSGSLVIFTGTDAFFEDERAGLKSYEALSNRVLSPIGDATVKSMKQPVLELDGLNAEKLKNIVIRVRDIHGHAYNWESATRLTDADIDALLEQWTTAGDKTIDQIPRPVLRELVQRLDILEENPDLAMAEIRPQLTSEDTARQIAGLLSSN